MVKFVLRHSVENRSVWILTRDSVLERILLTVVW